MNRLHGVFVAVVLLGFAAAVWVGRERSAEPLDDDFTTPAELGLRDLDPPFGEERVAGRVVDEAGDPAPGVLVFAVEPELDADAAPPIARDESDDDGRFELVGLGPGTHRVVTLLQGVPNTSRLVEVPTDGALELRLPAPWAPIAALPEVERVDVRGTLLAPSGFDAAEWPVGGYEVALVPAAGAHPLSGALERRVTVAADGTFELPAVVVAPYRLHVVPGWARGGSWPSVVERDYTPGATGSPVRTLELQLACGEVTGRAVGVDGLPIEGAPVTLTPAFAPERLYQPTNTDSDGRFRLRDVPPGEHLLRVRAGAVFVERSISVEPGARLAVPLAPLDPRPPEAGGQRL